MVQITDEIEGLGNDFSEIIVNGESHHSSTYNVNYEHQNVLGNAPQQNDHVGEYVDTVNLNNVDHPLQDRTINQQLEAETEARINADEGLQQAINTETSSRVSAINSIEELIPTQATAQNQLADKNFVNSSIGTNTSNYISNNGEPFTSVAQLEAYTGTVTNNDYAFVTGTDEDGNIFFDRYKATVTENPHTVSWGKEYRLNNSNFTAQQWETINSGITALLVQKLENVEAGAEVNTIESISVNGSPVNPDANRNVNLQVGGGDVESVNGKTGAVVLNASDVGAVGNTGDETIEGSKTFKETLTVQKTITYQGGGYVTGKVTFGNGYIKADSGNNASIWGMGNAQLLHPKKNGTVATTEDVSASLQTAKDYTDSKTQGVGVKRFNTVGVTSLSEYMEIVTEMISYIRNYGGTASSGGTDNNDRYMLATGIVFNTINYKYLQLYPNSEYSSYAGELFMPIVSQVTVDNTSIQPTIRFYGMVYEKTGFISSSISIAIGKKDFSTSSVDSLYRCVPFDITLYQAF